MTIISDKYDPKQAAKLSGIKSVPMIDYLQRTGVFVPQIARERHKGKKRGFTFKDLLVLKAIKRLLDSGASVALLKKSLVKFQKARWTADPVTLEDPLGIIRYLFVSGENVYLKKNAEEIINLSQNGQLTFSFVIDLDNLRTELRTALGLPVLEPEFGFVEPIQAQKSL